MNQDGLVNVVDIQACVNVFLGSETDAVLVKRSDVNKVDGVNVSDIQQIVNVFLGG